MAALNAVSRAETGPVRLDRGLSRAEPSRVDALYACFISVCFKVVPAYLECDSIDFIEITEVVKLRIEWDSSEEVQLQFLSEYGHD